MDSGAGIRLFCVFIFRLFERWKYRKFGGNRLQNPNFSPQMGDFRGFPAVMKIFILGCSGAIFRCKRASVMRGCVHARRTLKGLVADLRLIRKNSLIPKFILTFGITIPKFICIFGIRGFYFINYYSFWKRKNYRWLQNMNINIATNIKINKHISTTLFAMQISYWQ